MSDGTACGRCGEIEGHTPVDDDCVLRHSYDRKLHPSRATIGPCCAGCIERHREWVTEIVTLYGSLDEVLEAGSVPDDTAHHKHLKVVGSPSPIRLDAWALLHEEDLRHTIRREDGTGMTTTYLSGLPDIPAVLAGWAQAAYDTAGINANAPNTVSGAAIALRKHAEDLAYIPDIDTYDSELRWVRRSLRAAHSLGQPQDYGRCISVAPGRDCHGRVVSEYGETPQCKRCRRRYEYLDLVRLKKSQAS